MFNVAISNKRVVVFRCNMSIHSRMEEVFR